MSLSNKRFKISNNGQPFGNQSWLESQNKDQYYTYQHISSDEDIDIIEDLMADFRDDHKLFETMRDFLEYCLKAEYDRFMLWVRRLFSLQKYQLDFIKAQVRYLCQQISGRDFLYMHLDEVEYIMTYLENIIHWSQQKKIKLDNRDWIKPLRVFYRFRYWHHRSIRTLIQSTDGQNFLLGENEILKYVLGKYKLPEYFWQHFLKMSLSDQNIVMQLTHGAKIQNIQGLPIHVSNRDVHYLNEIPCHVDNERDYVAHGILLAKLMRASNRPELLPEFYSRNRTLLVRTDWRVFDHQEYFITLFVKICQVCTSSAPFQMIEYLDFFKAHVRNYQFNQYYRNISPATVTRKMREWHMNMFHGDVSDYDRYYWEGSGLKDFRVRHENNVYIFQEIKTGPELVNETIEMQHCVASYVESCLSGEIQIWSVKKQVVDSEKPFITMEITQGKVTQARKKHNAELSEKENFFIQTLEHYYKSEIEKKEEMQKLERTIDQAGKN